MEKGASCNERNEYGVTAFLEALSSKSLATVELLLGHGAYFATVDRRGVTALHFAAENKNVSVIEFILNQDFDIDSRTKRGVTALHVSVLARNLEGSEVLLRRGARTDSRCAEESTPLSLAVFYEIEDQVRLLLMYRLNTNTFKEAINILASISKNESQYNPTVNILLEAISIMKYLYANLPNYSRGSVFSAMNTSYKIHYQACREELGLIADSKFHENMSVLSILTGSEKINRQYIRNSDLWKSTEEVYSNVFPIYFEWLRGRFQIAVKWRIMQDTAVDIINNLVQFNDPFHVVSQKIVSYLTHSDVTLILEM